MIKNTYKSMIVNLNELIETDKKLTQSEIDSLKDVIKIIENKI